MLITFAGCIGETNSLTDNPEPFESEDTAPSIDNEGSGEKSSQVTTTEPPNQEDISSTFSSDDSAVSSKAPVTQQEAAPSTESPPKNIPSDSNDQMPIASEPDVGPFNPSPYVAEAIRHGESIGLIHDESYVSKGNWNPWVNLNNKLSEVQMMQNIRDSLQILVNEGREYFFVYAEPQIDGGYHIFIFFG